MCFFFFNDTATTEIYTLSLHDALPIYFAYPTSPTRAVLDRARCGRGCFTDSDVTKRMRPHPARCRCGSAACTSPIDDSRRSEEHTSELQSRQYLVCRLLLEKKKNKL